jgi:hypothetical protein
MSEEAPANRQNVDYSPLAASLRDLLAADAVIVVILGGEMGTGNGIANIEKVDERFRRVGPAILRDIADGLESGDGLVVASEPAE